MPRRSYAIYAVSFLLLTSACESATRPTKDVLSHDVSQTLDEGGEADLPETSMDAPQDVQCLPETPPPLGLRSRNLVEYARLRTSGTQPYGLWPIEAHDAIATIRDSQDATSWKAPVNEPSWIEIDLQPWTALQVHMDTLSITFDGTPPESVTVDLMPSCGATARQTIAWSDLAIPLQLQTTAGCIRVRLTAHDSLSVTSLDLQSRDARIEWPDTRPVDITSPGVIHPNNGVIEGFYGVPWSWRERQNMVSELAQNGMDTYLYAPKDDPLHRAQWRTPYPADQMKRFADLAGNAATMGVRFAFGISPFIDYLSDQEDYDILKTKCMTFIDAGAQIIAILADDIEFAPGVKVDAALGAMHVDVVNRLVDDLGVMNVAIWFTPTVYSDSRVGEMPGGKAYLDTVKGLDASVDVLWTGPDTGNLTLNAANMVSVSAAIGRRPLIWDNYWANDGGDGAFGRIFLAPYQGRSKDLVGEPPAVAGIAQNMSIQGAISRISLATFGGWSDDPGQADTTIFAARGIKHEMRYGYGASRDSQLDAQLLARAGDLFQGSSQDDPPHFMALENAASALVAVLKTGAAFDATKVRTLLPLLGRMVGLASELDHSGLDADLVDDLVFPLIKAAHEGRTGLLALSALAQRLSGKDASTKLSLMDDEVLLSASSRFLFSPDAVSSVVKAVRSVPVQTGAANQLANGQETPAKCLVGSELGFKPFTGETEVSVSGLPGATVDFDGTVGFRPAHGGTYSAIFTGFADSPIPGWAFREVAIVCTDPCQ